MLLDGLNELYEVQVLGPAAKVTADGATKAVDRQLDPATKSTYKVGGLGADKISIAFNVGQTSETWDTTTTLINLKLQESDDSTDGNDGTWTDVTDAMGLLYDRTNVTLSSSKQIQLTSSTTSDGKVYRLGYAGDARWVRGYIDIVGTQATGTYIGVTAQMSLPKQPANNAGN